MKITFFEVDKKEEKYLKDKFTKVKANVKFYNGELSLRNVKKAKDSEIIVLFIGSKINREILQKLPKLKYIATMSTGFDHIDLDACKKRKITVSNVPFYGENTVAEHTFALILALSRKIHEAITKTKNDNFSLDGLEGFDLKGKTLGVIGAGHIGQHVIRIAKGFEMNIVVLDNRKDKELAKSLGFTHVTLNELLKKSNIITIHAPYNEDTRHMINMNNIKMIKKGAYLINTARGGIVDTIALKYALDNNILAGAGLDVLEGEDDIKEEKELLKKNVDHERWQLFIRNHLLLKNGNVIVTPHSAFYSKEASERILDTTIENILGYIKGKKVNNVIM